MWHVPIVFSLNMLSTWHVFKMMRHTCHTSYPHHSKLFDTFMNVMTSFNFLFGLFVGWFSNYEINTLLQLGGLFIYTYDIFCTTADMKFTKTN